MGKLIKNYIYNGSYKLLIIIIPLITTPYLTRILGKDALGIDAYVLSVVALVELFGALGINLYSNREVAYCRDDKKKLSLVYHEIQSIRIFLCVVVVAAYALIAVHTKYKIFYLIHLLTIIGYFIDITWFFVGCEDMKSPVIRNVIVKVLQTLLVFLVIRSPSDLKKYIFITAICNFISAVCMYTQISKLVEKVSFRELNIKRHIKPILLLFLPQAASSLYVQFDRTMIGLLSEDVSYVSIYDKAEMIVKVPLQLATATSPVFIPRISNEFINGRFDNIKKIVNEEIRFIFLFMIPMMAGMLAIANNLVVWYLGKQYTESVSVMMILTPTILTIGMGEILGSQLMVSMNITKGMTIAFSVGAIANIILNYFMIPVANADGAAIATVFAELIVIVIQWIYTKKYINTKKIFASFVKKIIAAIIMYLIIEGLERIINLGYFIFVIQVVIGVIVYFLILYILKDKEMMDGIRILKEKLSSRKEA